MLLRRNKNGFTLIEILVAMVVSSIVMAAIYSLYFIQTKSHRKQQQIVEMQQNLRAAMYLMERDIKIAGYDPEDTKKAGITAAATNSITFTMDIGGGESDDKDNDNDGIKDEADEWVFSDGLIAGVGETLTYSLSGSTLMRDNGAGPQPAAFNIDSLSFDFFDNLGASLITGATVADDDRPLIRSVRITLTTTAGQGQDQTSMSITSGIMARNLGHK